MDLLIQIGIPVGLILIGLITGSILEKRHFQSIEKRESSFGDIALLSTRECPEDRQVEQSRLVQGSVVISIDYFKRLLANLRRIFGGEMRSYESLLDRGRREAILRMKNQFAEADLVINYRVITSRISKGGKRGKERSVGTVEVVAYGTAVKFADTLHNENRE